MLDWEEHADEEQEQETDEEQEEFVDKGTVAVVVVDAAEDGSI